MIHQPSGGTNGQASDIHIHAQEILKIRDRLNRCLADHTGQPIEKIELDTERDNFMSAEESKAISSKFELCGAVNLHQFEPRTSCTTFCYASWSPSYWPSSL